MAPAPFKGTAHILQSSHSVTLNQSYNIALWELNEVNIHSFL